MSGILTINLSHLTHNYNYLRSKINNKVKVLAVVKAIAYGNDAVAIAKHLENLGVEYFGVAYAEEGVELRQHGITTPILVLHPQPNNFELLTQYNLEPSIYSLRMLHLFSLYIQQHSIKKFPVHLKYNSGLNRLGFLLEDIPVIVKKIEETNLKVTSIFSHLAASEDLNEKAFTLQQIENFKQFATTLQDNLSDTPLWHQSNTSGILNYPEAHFSMVRTGIGLYGYGNDAKYDPNLLPVGSLTATISQIHTIKKGDSLGYNRKFIAQNTTKTATITIGHADGIDRIYGNEKGYVIVNGKKAPILGTVCMDMLMVNVTNIDCEEGDTVIIFNETFTAHQLAEAVGTISYELITGIGPRVKRKIINI